MKAHTTKYKKLSLKIRYVTLEYEEVKEQFDQYAMQMHERLIYLSKHCETSIFKESKKKSEKSTEPAVNKKTDKKQPKIFKELYRDIAKQAHPDVSGGDEDKTRLLRQATRAKNSNDLITMLDICDDLDIDTPELDEEHLEILERNIKSIENKITATQKTNAWTWGMADETTRRKYEHTLFHPLTSGKPK